MGITGQETLDESANRREEARNGGFRLGRKEKRIGRLFLTDEAYHSSSWPFQYLSTPHVEKGRPGIYLSPDEQP